MTLKVGHSKIFDKKVKKEPHERLVAYRDVRKERDGWVDVKKYLPDDFDLVTMNVLGRKPCAGWLCGTKWVGLRLRQGDIVKGWKRKKEIVDEE